MSESNLSTSGEPGPDGAENRFSFRAAGDRGCPNCGEVALAFDPSNGRACCRACGDPA